MSTSADKPLDATAAAARPPEPPPPPSKQKPAGPLRTALRGVFGGWIGRIALLGVMLLLLLSVAESLIGSLTYERQQRQAGVAQEIASTWSGRQYFAPPILIVPYTYSVSAGPLAPPSYLSGAFVLLPEALDIKVKLLPEIRRRGLFEAVVYTAQISATGSFSAGEGNLPELPKGAEIRWGDASLQISLSDLRSITKRYAVSVGGKEFPFAPGGTPVAGLPNGRMSARVGGAETLGLKPTAFALSFEVAGSEALLTYPFGRQTTTEIVSTWPDPSFQGRFLPRSRSIGDGGFDASWTVTEFGRNYPQVFTEGETKHADEITQSAYGVELPSLVTDYRLIERSLKYAVLMIGTVFAAMLLFEILGGACVHPVQYFLTGVAVVVQYVLLLALSEHLGFAVAYGLSVTAVLAVLLHYIRSVLGGTAAAAKASSALASVYGVIYIVLNLEDFALLAGAVALFAALAAFMHLTRRVDWGRAA